MRRVFRAELLSASFDREISRLAARQHGIFTRAQAKDLGASKGMVQHRVATGRWEDLRADVFRLGGTPPSWLQSLLAACFAWGQGSAISHRAAAALRGLTGFDQKLIELTVPPQRRRRNAPGLIHRSALPPSDVEVVRGIRVTTVPRTLIDVAGLVKADLVEEALDDARLRKLVTLPIMRAQLSQLSGGGRPGLTVIRKLLTERDPDAKSQSVFETKLLRLIRRAGLPAPVQQHEIRRDGLLVAIVDFAYPDLRVAIEAVGYGPHSPRKRWERDHDRGNQLTLMGWRVIYVTWRQLESRPKAVVASIRRALSLTEPGWP